MAINNHKNEDKIQFRTRIIIIKMDDALTYSIVFAVVVAAEYFAMAFVVMPFLEPLVGCFSFLHYLQVLMGRCRSSSGCWVNLDFYPPIIWHPDFARFLDDSSISGSVLDRFWISPKFWPRMRQLLQQPCFSPFCLHLTDLLFHYSKSIFPKTSLVQ